MMHRIYSDPAEAERGTLAPLLTEQQIKRHGRRCTTVVRRCAPPATRGAAIGVHDEIKPIRDLIEDWKPHVVFTMLEVHGEVITSSERARYPV